MTFTNLSIEEGDEDTYYELGAQNKLKIATHEEFKEYFKGCENLD